MVKKGEEGWIGDRRLKMWCQAQNRPPHTVVKLSENYVSKRQTPPAEVAR
jgi:hypothetical protein